jgi:hypothetical protein
MPYASRAASSLQTHLLHPVDDNGLTDDALVFSRAPVCVFRFEWRPSWVVGKFKDNVQLRRARAHGLASGEHGRPANRGEKLRQREVNPESHALEGRRRHRLERAKQRDQDVRFLSDAGAKIGKLVGDDDEFS